MQKTLPLVQLSTVLAMVASHQGISLVPALARGHESRPQCVFLALTGSLPTREINAVRNPARYQSKACAAFVELGQRVVRRLVAAAALILAGALP
jgi:DNA-binding transcriptional LysR family regulator